MKKKYKLDMSSTVKRAGKALHRIVALRSFGNVKKGDLGGYVESEWNLSQKGQCWVGDNAEVYDNARIHGNAHAFDDARIYGRAEVFDDAVVYEHASVYDDARVHDEVVVGGEAEVCKSTDLQGDISVGGSILFLF